MAVALREMESELSQRTEEVLSLQRENTRLRTAQHIINDELQIAEADATAMQQSLNESQAVSSVVSTELRREEGMRQYLVNRHEARAVSARLEAAAAQSAVTTELGRFEALQQQQAAAAVAERELVVAELGTADFELALSRRRERAARQQQVDVAGINLAQHSRGDGATLVDDDATGPSGPS